MKVKGQVRVRGGVCVFYTYPTTISFISRKSQKIFSLIHFNFDKFVKLEVAIFIQIGFGCFKYVRKNSWGHAVTGNESTTGH